MKRLLTIVVVVVLLIAGGVAAYIKVSSPSPAPVAAATAPTFHYICHGHRQGGRYCPPLPKPKPTPPKPSPTPTHSTPTPTPTKPSPTPTKSTPPPTPTPTPSKSTPPPTPTPTPTNSNAPAVPSGYALTYSHDFTTQGMGDWVLQGGNNAPVAISTANGLGITLNATSEWSELISLNAVVGPNSFVQAEVYIPAGSGTNGEGDSFPAGSSANWPAFWTTGNPWPQNGEIDALEVQSGRSCEQTHYSSGPSSSTEINSQSNCGPLGADSTGWLTVSILRTGETVKVWYNNVYIGEVPLPTTANEELIWQNQSYSTSVCAHCFGPTVLGSASTAYLKNVQVYSSASGAAKVTANAGLGKTGGKP